MVINLSVLLGIYNMLFFMIICIVGVVFYWVCVNFGCEKGRKNNDLFVFVSGFVLGEFVVSFIGFVFMMMFKRFGGY